VEKRRLGRTGHMSTLLTFGCAALATIPQKEADSVIDLALSHGINHFDVAPGYGDAELRLKSWMAEHRKNIFLACKTDKKTKKDALIQLHASLKRIGVDYFDLYQLHGVSTIPDLDAALGKGGAIETIVAARSEGLARFIGITGHSEPVQIEALRRFDFDTVMFPMNIVLSAHPKEDQDRKQLLRLAKEKDAGTIIIKAVAKKPWGNTAQRYNTWYEPFDDEENIFRCIRFVLTHDVTTAATASDCRLVPHIIKAAEEYTGMSDHEIEQTLAYGKGFQPLFSS
jgi:predicted aldo/keto reductase-like oxidoreductase